MSDLINKNKSLVEWKEDFKGFVEWLDIPRDDYVGIMEYIDEVPSAESEINKQKLIRTMNVGIIATNTEDVYSCGMRNGIRWCRALLEDDPPKFEDASQYAEQEIIMCKDCKHWERESCVSGYCHEIGVSGLDEDFYCGYAERKNE